MNKKITLQELFEQVNSATTVPAKLEILKKNYNRSVAGCLSMLFNPNIVFALPEGIPEGYEFSNSSSLSIERAMNSFPAFVNQDNLTEARKVKLQQSWLRLMNSLVHKDALFAYDLKDKKVETGLSQADVHAAFPNLIPAPTEPTSETPKNEKSVESVKEPVGESEDNTASNKAGDVKPAEDEKAKATKKPASKKVGANAKKSTDAGE